MNIIKTTANENGSRPPIQQWSGATIPDGYAAVQCDTAPFHASMGFVALTIKDGAVTAMEANTQALDTYKVSLPVPEPLQPTPQEDTDALTVDHEYRLTLLELGVEKGAN